MVYYTRMINTVWLTVNRFSKSFSPCAAASRLNKSLVGLFTKRCLTEVMCACLRDVPGCLRWWSMGSQTWHWLVASPPCLQPLHSADRSGLASSTPFHPATSHNTNSIIHWKPHVLNSVFINIDYRTNAKTGIFLSSWQKTGKKQANNNPKPYGIT